MRRTLLAAAVGALVVVLIAPASARPTTTKVSGSSPFPQEGCGQREEALRQVVDGDPHGAEIDLSVASNPINPKNLVAAWVQDGGMGIVTASSFDGGRSWQPSVPEGLSACTGGKFHRILHARLAFSGDGVLWLTGEALDGFFPDPRSGINGIPVVTSRDGGRTWSRPVYVAGDTQMNGLNTIAGHPSAANTAAVVWHTPEPIAETFVSTSTDGGATWTVRPVPGDPVEGGLPFTRLVIGPDDRYYLFRVSGSLVGFVGADSPPNIELLQSADRGQTWTEPSVVAMGVPWQWPSAAVAPDGTVSVGWLADSTMYVRSSRDSGGSWSAPTVAANGIVGPTPTLAANGSGDLGVGYVTSSGTGFEQLQLAISRDIGATWTTTTLDSPFAEPADVRGVFGGADGGMADIPKERGFYMETTGIGDRGFATIYQRGGETDGPSDAYVATHRVGAAAARRG